MEYEWSMIKVTRVRMKVVWEKQVVCSRSRR